MSSLKAFLEGVTFTQIKKLFGAPDPGGFVEEEKGYDGNEYTLTESSTGEVLQIYSRYSSWRIGAFDKDAADRLAAWVKERCL